MNEGLGTFAERFPILFEPAGRQRKAAKAIAVLQHHLGDRLRGAVLLEVGSSTCIMAAEFAKACREVIAFDIDPVALRAGYAYCRDIPNIADAMRFLVGDATHMSVADHSVDVVICNQVYEHVDDQTGLMREIYRVLRPGGVCYFGIGTRHVIIEGHYKLPFLSWITPRLADIYVKLRGRQLRYDVKLLSYRNLQKLAGDFIVHDYTVDIIRHPSRYFVDELLQLRAWLSQMKPSFLAALRPILPVHVWLLEKPQPGETPARYVVNTD